MPSLRCDLQCSFCMYDSKLYETEVLDLEKTSKFINQWNWSDINQVGFYGGEPSINLPLYQQFANLINYETSRFIITNGSWSTDTNKTMEFIRFVIENRMYLIVSGTKEHIPYQSRSVLHMLKSEFPKEIRLKGDDVIHSMGRAKDIVHPCNSFCQTDDRVMRLAIHPSGNIMYQNCHGDYPIVQTIEDKYDGIYERALKVAKKCSINQRNIYVKR